MEKRELQRNQNTTFFPFEHKNWGGKNMFKGIFSSTRNFVDVHPPKNYREAFSLKQFLVIRLCAGQKRPTSQQSTLDHRNVADPCRFQHVVYCFQNVLWLNHSSRVTCSHITGKLYLKWTTSLQFWLVEITILPRKKKQPSNFIRQNKIETLLWPHFLAHLAKCTMDSITLHPEHALHSKKASWLSWK